jgi:predicted nucleic acid-binding protein
MIDRIFIDSNVWLYFFLKDEEEKYRIAEKYFLENATGSVFIITYQVINEVANQLIKNNHDEITIVENIEYMYKISTIQDFSKEIILSASELRQRYSLSFWDSIIVTSAIKSNCNILATEDMQDGLIIEHTEIKNIFKK